MLQAAPNPDAADPAAAEAELHYTEEELASVLGNLGRTFKGDQDSKHSERKKITYETALKIFKGVVNFFYNVFFSQNPSRPIFQG